MATKNVKKPESKIDEMIPKKQQRIDEIKHKVYNLTALKEYVKRGLNQIINEIEEQEKNTEKQAEDFIKYLEQEISKLRNSNTEVEQLSHPEGHHLRIFHPVFYEGVLRDVDQLIKKIELRWVQQYARDVTLDPDTAHGNLTLTDENKKVTHGNIKQNFTTKKNRFTGHPSVLAKQSFSSSRNYFEVEVKEKPEWELGVAKESIDKKGKITLSPQKGYWVLRKKKEEYIVHTDDYTSVHYCLKSSPEKVGVFVDYEKGVVSFYDVAAAAVIHSLTGWLFTEKLYPYFSPCDNDSNKNTAPLIISPVNR